MPDYIPPLYYKKPGALGIRQRGLSYVRKRPFIPRKCKNISLAYNDQYDVYDFRYDSLGRAAKTIYELGKMGWY